METYVLRIYRRGESGPGELLGVLEPVDGDGHVPFRTQEELCRALTQLPPTAAPGQAQTVGTTGEA